MMEKLIMEAKEKKRKKKNKKKKNKKKKERELMTGKGSLMGRRKTRRTKENESKRSLVTEIIPLPGNTSSSRTR